MTCSTTRRRQKPRVYDWSYLVLRDLRNQVMAFAKNHVNVTKNTTVMDIGCGQAPYQVFFQCSKYLKLDHFASPNIDVMGTIENLPVEDSSLDFILCTQVFEHTDDFGKAVQQIHRVLKLGGKAFISFPFAAHIHGTDDRWRFSCYTIEQVFKKFNILSIRSSGGTMISWGQYFNIFIAAFPLLRFLYPVFVLVNVGSLCADFVLSKIILPPFRWPLGDNAYRQMVFNVNESLPLNYSIVVEK